MNTSSSEPRRPGWFGHPVLSLLLGLSWLALSRSIEPVHLLSALLIGLIVPRLLGSFLAGGNPIHWPTAVRLALVVLKDIVLSNITVARLVLGPMSRPQPAWLPVPLATDHPRINALFATIITTTPGTVSCVVDLAGRQMDNFTGLLSFVPDDGPAIARVLEFGAQLDLGRADLGDLGVGVGHPRQRGVGKLRRHSEQHGPRDQGREPAREADRILSEHIATICRRYGQRIGSYDVVNEAVDPDTGGLRETSLSRAMGGTAGTLLTGSGFTDTAVKTRGDLNDYRIIHFATHGLVTAPRPSCPARPALVTSFGDSGSDGLLTFQEIYDLKIDADLVILSACDTAGAASVGATREAGLASGGGFGCQGPHGHPDGRVVVQGQLAIGGGAGHV